MRWRTDSARRRAFFAAYLTPPAFLILVSITVSVNIVRARMPGTSRGVSSMPACARRQIVDEERIGVYHCIARCVRRAFLCGLDPYTGQDYSHRKDWILDRLRELAGLFGVEVCGYSVMSNHLHLVLRNRPDLARARSAEEVALRWCRVFPPRDDAMGKLVEPSDHDLALITADSDMLEELRKRLASLSWFMRCLCENVAGLDGPSASRGQAWGDSR